MKKVLVITLLAITGWLFVCLFWYRDKFMDYFVIPILIAVVAGLVTNLLQGFFENTVRSSRIKKALQKHIGNYTVYHWRDLTKPDGCNYKVSIQLDEKKGALIINHTGQHDYDTWTSEVRMDEMTLSYGEGNYIHPQKEKNAFGRIKLFLLSNAINVDKIYLDMEDESVFAEKAEKWQWRKVD